MYNKGDKKLLLSSFFLNCRKVYHNWRKLTFYRMMFFFLPFIKVKSDLTRSDLGYSYLEMYTRERKREREGVNEILKISGLRKT